MLAGFNSPPTSPPSTGRSTNDFRRGISPAMAIRREASSLQANSVGRGEIFVQQQQNRGLTAGMGFAVYSTAPQSPLNGSFPPGFGPNQLNLNSAQEWSPHYSDLFPNQGPMDRARGQDSPLLPRDLTYSLENLAVSHADEEAEVTQQATNQLAESEIADLRQVSASTDLRQVSASVDLRQLLTSASTDHRQLLISARFSSPPASHLRQVSASPLPLLRRGSSSLSLSGFHLFLRSTRSGIVTRYELTLQIRNSSPPSSMSDDFEFADHSPPSFERMGKQSKSPNQGNLQIRESAPSSANSDVSRSHYPVRGLVPFVTRPECRCGKSAGTSFVGFMNR
ncbi:hypothetical protein LINPERHAP2_LOCUS10696 [Linum perenne]